MGSNKRNYIERLKRKKEDALEYVVDEYIALVKVIVYKVLKPLGQEEAAKECINDIFFAIWEHSDKFQGTAEEDFKKWVYKIAKYEAIDYYRRLCKNVTSSLDETPVEEVSSGGVEDEIMKNESTDELIKLINTLDETDQQIFTMKFFLGHTAEEIGKKLGLSRTAVDNRVYRAKAKLKKNMTVLKEAMI